MTKEQLKEYSLKVTQSNKSQLVVVTYEIILQYLKEALGAYKEDNREDFFFSCKKAKQFIDNLSSSLDMTYDISSNLSAIYRFCGSSLSNNIVKGTDENIDELIQMLTELKGSFEQLALQDDSKAVLQNDSQVYAGLTYGKGTLNETVVSGNLFQAWTGWI